MPNWRKVITSGSDASLNTLTVSNGITGSLFGTASYATQALSASFAPSTPTFPFTGSAIVSGSLTVTGSLNITGSSTITNGALILSSSAGSAIILRTAGDSVVLRDNYGLAGRAILSIGTNGISIHNAGGDPTITCPIGMNLNSSATIYSSATSHIFYGGTNKQVSIGTAAVPTAKLHIAAGAAAATSAPIKLTAGTNMTTPEAGAIEFNGNSLFFTTGSTRSTILTNTNPASITGNVSITGSTTTTGEIIFGSGTLGVIRFGPTSGAIFAASTTTGTTLYPASANLVSFGDQTNGNPLVFRFFCNSVSTYGLSIGTGGLATARLHIVGGTTAASTAPIKLTAGTNLTTPEAGAIEFNGTNLFFTTGSTRSTVLTNTSPASITGNLVVTGSLLVSGSVTLNGNAGVNIIGNTIITGSLLLSGSSLVAGITPIPLAGTIKDGVTSVLGSLNDWNSNYYQGDVLYSETAGGTITFGQLCYRTQNETWELADATAANAAAAFNMLGICVKSSTSTNPTSILINGFVETATYATIVKSGEPLYMATTAGSMTKTAPTTVGNAVRIIGHTFWDSNTNSKIIIRFNPENSWIEL